MRERERIVGSLERMYREAFQKAVERDDAAARGRLDFEFQRDQVFLEVLLDVRELLSAVPAPAEGAEETGASSLLQKAEALRRITRLR